MESGSVSDDVDVTAEHERVLSGDADEDLLRLENLTKVSLNLQPQFHRMLPCKGSHDRPKKIKQYNLCI